MVGEFVGSSPLCVHGNSSWWGRTLVIVKKWKGNNEVFKCLEMAKPSESLSVHLNFFSIKNLQHNSSFVMRPHVKREQSSWAWCSGLGQPWAKHRRAGPCSWGAAFHDKRVESLQITVLLICSVTITVSCVLLLLPDKNNSPHFCCTV